MPLMTWSDRLSIGVESIDAEHRELVSMLNDFYDAMKAGKGRDASAKILMRLLSYTEQHFKNEEALFAKHVYPDAAAHRQEHAALRAEADKIRKKLDGGDTSPLASVQLMTFLKDWLTKHIQGSDRKFGMFLASQHPQARLG